MDRKFIFCLILISFLGCSSGESVSENSTVDPPSTEPTTQSDSKQKTEVKSSAMPIYVTPYYNSEGPKIEVGRFSKELTAATSESIQKLAAKMQKEWQNLSVETMYVLSIRLYDLGLKDYAVYWFYAAQMRSKIFRSALEPDSIGGIGSEAFERMHAHNSFHQLAGTYINGYGFGELAKLQATILQVKSDSKKLPPLKKIYPNVAFIDKNLWADHQQKIVAGLDGLLKHINDNKFDIKEQRKKNGIEGKY